MMLMESGRDPINAAGEVTISGGHSIEVEQLPISPLKLFYVEGGNSSKAKRVQVSMFEHKNTGNCSHPFILELKIDGEEKARPTHHFLSSFAVFQKISMELDPFYLGKAQTVKEGSPYAKELMCEWVYSRVGLDGSLLPMPEDSCINGRLDVIIDEPDQDCLGNLPILSKSSPPLSRKGSISPPSVSMRKSVDWDPPFFVSGHTLEESRRLAVLKIEQLFPASTTIESCPISQEQQQQPHPSNDTPIQYIPFSTMTTTTSYSTSHGDEETACEDGMQLPLSSRAANTDHKPSSSSIDHVPSSSSSSSLPSSSPELISELMEALSPRFFPVTIPTPTIPVSEPLSSNAAPPIVVQPVAAMSASIISTTPAAAPSSSSSSSSSVPAPSTESFDAIWGKGGNNPNNATRGVRKYPPRKASPFANQSTNKKRLTFAVPMVPRAGPKNASLQPHLSTYLESDEGEEEEEEEEEEDDDEEDDPMVYHVPVDDSPRSSRLLSSLIEQSRLEAIKDADTMMMEYTNSPTNFNSHHHRHTDGNESKIIPSQGQGQGQGIIANASTETSTAEAGLSSVSKGIIPPVPQIIASPPTYPRPSRRQVTRGGFRIQSRPNASTDGGYHTMGGMIGHLMGGVPVGADRVPMHDDDMSEMDETWRDAGERDNAEEIGLSQPSPLKEIQKEWACDIMKRLIEDEDVGSDEDTPPPQVLRSVTQELGTTVETEEQPPWVGRAHTSEF